MVDQGRKGDSVDGGSEITRVSKPKAMLLCIVNIVVICWGLLIIANLFLLPASPESSAAYSMGEVAALLLAVLMVFAGAHSLLKIMRSRS
jgi:hypothetical protein